MDADYIADLEGEVQVLRGRIAELEEELRQAKEDLSVAHERKVEEVITHSFLLLCLGSPKTDRRNAFD